MRRANLLLSTIAAAAAAVATACDPLPAPGPDAGPEPRAEAAESGVCRQPGGEFGAGACASVTGRVLGSDGRPLPGGGLSGIIIPEQQRCPCNAPGLVVDSAGRFAGTVHWFAGPPPRGTQVSAVVRVAATGWGYPQPTPETAYTDSAVVTLHFVPIGERVLPARVELRLPVTAPRSE